MTLVKEAPDALTALSQQHRELADLLHGLPADSWSTPTRCDGWDVSDVVMHLAQTDEMAVASLEDRFGEFIAARAGGGASSIDEGAELMVQRERGVPVPSLVSRWSAGADRLDSLFAAADPHRRVTWVAGSLSVQTLAATRLTECWIHTGDIAAAVGASPVPDGRLFHIARLAWRTLPYAFAREGMELSGPVGFVLSGPGGEEWSFVGDDQPATMVRGDALELCLVAGRRLDPGDTSLIAYGADGEAVLALVRTYA